MDRNDPEPFWVTRQTFKLFFSIVSDFISPVKNTRQNSDLKRDFIRVYALLWVRSSFNIGIIVAVVLLYDAT